MKTRMGFVCQNRERERLSLKLIELADVQEATVKTSCCAAHEQTMLKWNDLRKRGSLEKWEEKCCNKSMSVFLMTIRLLFGFAKFSPIYQSKKKIKMMDKIGINSSII